MDLVKVSIQGPLARVILLTCVLGGAYFLGRAQGRSQAHAAGSSILPDSENIPSKNVIASSMDAGREAGRALDSRLMLAQLAQLPRGQQAETAYQLAFEDWARRSKEDAAEAALTLPMGAEKAAALRGVASGWAAQDPAGALEWSSKRAPEDSPALRQAIAAVSVQNPKLAAQYVDKLTDAFARDEAIGFVARDMSAQDPAVALDFLDRAAAGVTYDNAVNQIFKQLSQRNPATAVELLAKLTDQRDRDSVIATLAQGWSDTDPKSTLDWLQTLQDTDGTARSAAFHTVMNRWAKSDVQAAILFVNQSPDPAVFKSAAPVLAQVLSKSDPATALAWAKVVADESTRLNLIQIALINMAKNNAEAAFQALQNIPLTDVQRTNLAETINQIQPSGK